MKTGRRIRRTSRLSRMLVKLDITETELAQYCGKSNTCVSYHCIHGVRNIGIANQYARALKCNTADILEIKGKFHPFRGRRRTEEPVSRGKYLRELFRMSGLTQAKAASIMGIGVTLLNFHWRHGISCMGTAESYARHLHCHPFDLLDNLYWKE